MKVLLVDDDEKLTAAIKRGLLPEGFTVDIADNGVDGLWRATEGSYDVVVLDLMLPGLNGYRVCSDLRAAGNWTPVLMLTAMDGDLDEAEGLDIGADDYVVKPFSFPVLVSRLHALVRRGSSSAPSPITAGDLEIDPLGHQVWVAGEGLSVTSREFDVLSHLVRHRGHMLSKRQILDEVWSDDFDGDPNIVEVYVGRLRRKLEERSSRATIETIRGAGYRLSAG